MGGLGRGQGGCERRIEVFVKIKKRNFFFGGGGGGVGLGGRVGGSGWGGCERRIEVFVKIQKKKKIFFWGGGGGGVCVVQFRPLCQVWRLGPLDLTH